MADNEGKMNISVEIAGRTYNLSGSVNDEASVKAATELIEKKLNFYKSTNRYRDYQDLLAMLCLQFATLNVKMEKDEEFKNKNLRQSLENINALLDENIDEGSLK